MTEASTAAERIRFRAVELGFDLVGFGHAEAFETERAYRRDHANSRVKSHCAIASERSRDESAVDGPGPVGAVCAFGACCPWFQSRFGAR